MRLISIVLFAALAFTGAAAQEQGKVASDAGPVLIVQQAVSATYDGAFLTLRGVPATVWFSDRPQRRTGHLATADYLAAWQPGGDFAEDPPNAALAIEGNAADDTVVVVLNSAEMIADGVFRYGVTVVAGTLPAAAAKVALFIDPAGQQDGTQSRLQGESNIALSNSTPHPLRRTARRLGEPPRAAPTSVFDKIDRV